MRTTCVANDELHHVALPKLYGAPAYARPKVEPVARADRPFDPDELPIESAQTEEERRLIAELTARSSVAVEAEPDGATRASASGGGLPFRLPSLTGLLRSGGSVTGVAGNGGVTGLGTDGPPADLAVAEMATPPSGGPRVTITGDLAPDDDAANPVAGEPEPAPDATDQTSPPVGE